MHRDRLDGWAVGLATFWCIGTPLGSADDWRLTWRVGIAAGADPGLTGCLSIAGQRCRIDQHQIEPVDGCVPGTGNPGLDRVGLFDPDRIGA